MLSINGKKFMNLPEAVQWLLNNNALPFQCKANYVADTVIAKSDIINPSPAEIKVGSLVLFADSKVGTISGITDSGFMVGQDYTDIGAQLNQIVGIDLDASQHLIFTLANGDTIDAGMVKGVSGFSINASQHLIVSYNDGTTQDLGAIFQGNINIAGNLTANSIIENMSGYTFTEASSTHFTASPVYAGIVKNGNKLTLVYAVNITRVDSYGSTQHLAYFDVPQAVKDALYPTQIGSYMALSYGKVNGVDNSNNFVDLNILIEKSGVTGIILELQGSTFGNLPLNVATYVRIEQTFLLSENLAN